MIANISNQNFGYQVACDTVWEAVGNPSLFRYNAATSSLTYTGSVEIYRYNINTDTHNPKTFLYRPLTVNEQILISTENSNSFTIPQTGPYYFIQTELTGTVPYTADLDLLVDVGQYHTASEDGYGLALDMKGTILAVGNPYFTSTYTFQTESFVITGSGNVDLYDLSTLDIDPYAIRIPTSISNLVSSSIGGIISAVITVPSFQNYTSVLLQSLDSNIPSSSYQTINVGQTSNGGGTLTLSTGLTNLNNISLQSVGVVGINPYLTTIFNPDTSSVSSGSFGYSVSLNDEWLAVGSPLESGSRGSVFMFRKLNGNNLSWSYVQSLPLPSNIGPNDNFGFSIGMNKATSSYSWSMVVGSNKPSSSNAYIYEFNGNCWLNTFTLNPDNTTVYPLPFYPTFPIVVNYPNIYDSFGYSVAMYGTSVIVGAPTDRIIEEYVGAPTHQQGAVYFFERCNGIGSPFYMVKKSYGNENIINDNLLGTSVSIYDQYAVSGIPKINALSSSICFLRGSLFQYHFCDDTTDTSLNGQYVLYNKVTSSLTVIPTVTSPIDWNITNVYQIKKQFLSPYRVYGWDTDISNQFITIGSPMLISGSNTIMYLNPFTGSFTGSVNDLGDLSGKAYIYNLQNLKPNFYVGNVFYSNGKIVIMTSGSAFEGLQFNTLVNEDYQYNLNFTSEHTIYEKQIVCPVDIGEFNVSTNPTAIVTANAEFDINKNGIFDFQDADVLLRVMAYNNSVTLGIDPPSTDWSSSIVDTSTNEEPTVYNMYYSQWQNTDSLFSSSYSFINNNIFGDLDFNDDNKVNTNDMNILWKYFIYRLTQKNYGMWITPNSQNKFLANIINYLNGKTLRGQPPTINPTFLQSNLLSQMDPTGSYLYPAVTTVGLYNGCDLVAIAKLGSPIKITPNFPINFIVKMDF